MKDAALITFVARADDLVFLRNEEDIFVSRRNDGVIKWKRPVDDRYSGGGSSSSC